MGRSAKNGERKTRRGEWGAPSGEGGSIIARAELFASRIKQRGGSIGCGKVCKSRLTEVCYLTFQLFRGNFDRFSLVEQPIDPPVNGRFIRFNPRSWHAHISMRVEVYGCRAGENRNDLTEKLYSIIVQLH